LQEKATNRSQILSPFDRKYLLSPPVNSVVYAPDGVIIRYYVIPDLDAFLTEKGAAKGPALERGFAAPGAWRPKYKLVGTRFYKKSRISLNYVI
jgi:hypothetical protein